MKYIAIDLGAESGRVMAGILEDEKLQLHEMHRFANQPVRCNGVFYWDFLRLWHDITEGLRRAVAEYGASWDGVGVDTWGVDFGLLDERRQLLGNPVHYRDGRTHGVMKSTFERCSQPEIFASTGVQFMELNTLYQLIAMQQQSSPQLKMARTLLLMPDLLHYALSGICSAEYTIASTTQMLNANACDWDRDLLERLNLPARILPEIIMPGTVLGSVLPEVAARTGLDPQTPVIAPGGHDTASAVAAVPAESGDNWAYLSSGTWSLMGVELDKPLINAAVQKYNFTNEGGVDGKIRFLKNIAGLWLVQECRRSLARDGHEYSYAELTQKAADAEPLESWIDPDDAAFMAPLDMPEAIREYCKRTSQKPPEDESTLIRICLESLALKYRWTLEKLEELTGRKLDILHIVGGGTQNALLCQLTADCLGRKVIAGPVEATASGNILVQAMANNHIRSLAHLRQVVRNSWDVISYEPHMNRRNYWDEAYSRFVTLS
jgi:rhamnulokinase